MKQPSGWNGVPNKIGCLGGETVLYTCHSVPLCTELALAPRVQQAPEQMPSQRTYKYGHYCPKHFTHSSRHNNRGLHTNTTRPNFRPVGAEKVAFQVP